MHTQQQAVSITVSTGNHKTTTYICRAGVNLKVFWTSTADQKSRQAVECADE